MTPFAFLLGFVLVAISVAIGTSPIWMNRKKFRTKQSKHSDMIDIVLVDQLYDCVSVSKEELIEIICKQPIYTKYRIKKGINK